MTAYHACHLASLELIQILVLGGMSKNQALTSQTTQYNAITDYSIYT
jgi:hypothetical protein